MGDVDPHNTAGSRRRVLGLLGVTSLVSLVLFTVAPERSFADLTCPIAGPATLYGAREKVAGNGWGCLDELGGTDRLSVWSRSRLGIETRLRKCEWASTDLVDPRLRCRSDAVCRSAVMYRSKIVYENFSDIRVDVGRWRHLC